MSETEVLKARIADVDRRMENAEKDIEGLELRVEALEVKTSNLEVEIEGIKAHTKGLGDRVDSVEGSILAIHNMVYPRKESPQPRQEQQPSTEKDKSNVLFGLDPAIAGKLIVTEHNGEVRVRPDGWLGKQTWTMVNKFLKQDGFQWVKEAKNSSWRRRS